MNNKFNYLVLSSQNSVYHDLFERNKNDKMSSIGATSDAEEAFMLVKDKQIDAVIVELNTPTAEAYEFIDKISFLAKRPIIVVISSLQEESYYTRARRLGARLVYRSPFNIDSVFEDICLALRNESEEISIVVAPERTVSDKAMDEKLANIFIASGIPPHIKGYKFLREAVKQSVANPSMINHITKQLYPAIANKFDTTPSKVERAIRHAIEVAWSRGKIENINSIYGIKVFSKTDKPTNGELIALISDKMIIECSI